MYCLRKKKKREVEEVIMKENKYYFYEYKFLKFLEMNILYWENNFYN